MTHPTLDGAVPTWLQLFLDVPRDRWDAALAFWPAATGWQLAPTRGEDGQFTTLIPPAGAAWVKLQAIDDPEARVHVDLDAADRSTAVSRSLAAGATQQWVYSGVPVMRSPGGLLFCHTLSEPGRQVLDRSADLLLDQVCLDVPARLWDAETAFWSAITGRSLEAGSMPEFARLVDADAAATAPRILLQRLTTDAPGVSGHPDFAVRDRAATAARHQSLGAERIRDCEHWSVLRAPSGHVYCLTDRDPATGVL